MKKMKFPLVAMLLMAFALPFITACDGLEGGEVDVTLKDANIDIPVNFTPKTEDGLRSTTSEYTFKGMAIVDFGDDMFDAVREKGFESFELIVKDVLVKITEDGATTGQVTEFKAECYNATSVKIGEYKTTNAIGLDQDFRDEKLTAFVRLAFFAIQTQQKITIKVEGKTTLDSSVAETGMIVILPSIMATGKLSK